MLYPGSPLLPTEAPDWVGGLPANVKSYYDSVVVAEASIISKVARGPAPTEGPRVQVVGAALAVGAAGLAML